MGNSALLIIGAQVGIIEGIDNGPVYEKDALLGVLKKIIDAARQSDLPLIYIMDLDVAEQSTMDFQIHPHIAPFKDETIITKKSTDAFHSTNLSDYLLTMDIQHLVIAGCKTEYNIDTTCRSATTLGYDVTLIEDGHSTTDNEVLKAKDIIAHHNYILHGLTNGTNSILIRSSDEEVFEHRNKDYESL